jgi:SAM-dependent methyltransferase
MGKLKRRPAEQHLLEISLNRAAWARKPLLQLIYADFYRLIQKSLSDTAGPVVELGSGIGAIKGIIPECITTDIFLNPWIDRRENAYSLSFGDETLSNLILLDVFHHLEYPGTALQEFSRILRPGGRVILLEPGMGTLGKAIYALFHHEPTGLRDEITWFAPGYFHPESTGYYAAQANAWRIFAGNNFLERLSSWEVIKVQPLPQIAYAASGGFSKPQFFPGFLLPLVRKIESFLELWPKCFATRLLVVLQKPFCARDR